MNRLSTGTAWLIGTAALLVVGVALIVAGTRPPSPARDRTTDRTSPATSAAPPNSATPAGSVAHETTPVATPTGSLVRADSTNTPPALLAALAGTSGGDPAL
ncbi:MAG TPA: hypothetical protein VF720_03925, partial [Candidatus Eisenbacteria bacterium]